jgi:hypothetical protein
VRRGNAVADPFGERAPFLRRPPLALLGTEFHFEATHPALLALVDRAYQGLPAQRWPGAARSARVRLVQLEDEAMARWREPPTPRTCSGGGLLCGVSDGANFAVVSPGTRSALVALSPRMLRHPYHARYELLEFAVFTLAARVRALVPLHAACVGAGGRALLLVGDSGAGKSTLALHALLAGLELTSEDATFVCPSRLLASGVANYLHVRPDAVEQVRDRRSRQLIARSPVIRRRSGVEKLEVDLRLSRQRLAAAPARLAGIVFLSTARAATGALVRPLARAPALARLAESQPYAAGTPGWSRFLRRAAALPLLELRRAAHPEAGAEALRALLARHRPAGRRRSRR